MAKRVGISPVSEKASAERSPGRAPRTRMANRGVDRFMRLQQAIGNRATQGLLAGGLLQPNTRIGPVKELQAPVSRVQRKCAECEEEEKEGAGTLQRKPRSSGLSPIQSKLKVSEPGDKYEREADRVALRVMRSHRTSDGPKEGAAGVASNSASKRGNLDSNTKAFMESRFSTNFDQVRVHTGRRAAKAAVALDARAFTIGPDIYFGSGEYRPHASSGRQLLAHELTHVVQQGYANPMVQRQETDTTSDVIDETSEAPAGESIAPVVDEADKGTRKAIAVLEKALLAADGALAEKAFPEEKLARIRVQADKLRPMLEAYRKVDRGEPPDPGLTLDFDPQRDQIDEGDADVLATGHLEDSEPVGSESPQAFASRREHGLVSLRVDGVDVQRAVCGGLCIAAAIALGGLLLSGCSRKKKKPTTTCCPKSGFPKVTHTGTTETRTTARHSFDIVVEYETDGTKKGAKTCSMACCEFRQVIKGYWKLEGVKQVLKSTGSGLTINETTYVDDGYSNSDDTDSSKYRLETSDRPGGGFEEKKTEDYYLNFAARTLDTCDSNKIVARKTGYWIRINGKFPRTFTKGGF